MAIILITGAKGQLGSELKEVSKNFYGYDFIFTDIDSLDITSLEKISEFIKKSKPDWIINCAAYTLVDKAEVEPDQALLINGTAVKNITEAIRDLNADSFMYHRIMFMTEVQMSLTTRISLQILYQPMADQNWPVKNMPFFTMDQ